MTSAGVPSVFGLLPPGVLPVACELVPFTTEVFGFPQLMMEVVIPSTRNSTIFNGEDMSFTTVPL